MPTDDLKHNWADAMTLPRILELKDGKMIQRPMDEMIEHRTNEKLFQAILNKKILTHIKGKVLEIVVEIENIDAKQFGIKFLKTDDEETVITYDVISSKVIFDRTKSGYLSQGNTEKDANRLFCVY